MKNALEKIVFSILFLFTLNPVARAVPVYWNLFNFEEESTLDSIYVTYGALDDMLTDSNRTGSFIPGAGGAAQNVIGSGAFVAFQADIPEPSAFALLGCGLAGLLLARRRWKNGSGPDEAGAPISKP
mgnify:CR=1 FL=1